MGTYEKALKEYWPKALEIVIFLVLMVTTMKSELGDNSRLIDRNHEDIISMKQSHEQISGSTLRMEYQLQSIERRLSRIEDERSIPLILQPHSGMSSSTDVQLIEGSL